MELEDYELLNQLLGASGQLEVSEGCIAVHAKVEDLPQVYELYYNNHCKMGYDLLGTFLKTFTSPSCENLML